MPVSRWPGPDPGLRFAREALVAGWAAVAVPAQLARTRADRGRVGRANGRGREAPRRWAVPRRSRRPAVHVLRALPWAGPRRARPPAAGFQRQVASAVAGRQGPATDRPGRPYRRS